MATEKRQLTISSTLKLPLSLVTTTQAILARKRSGKSYTASVEAEEMLEAGVQVLVFDPTSAWWGLRSSADGKSPGYAVVVFGGDHAQAPLDPSSGTAMARAAIERGFSAVFDIGNFRLDEQLQFVADFFAEMLRLNRNPVHLFLDEADTFAPQQSKSKAATACLNQVARLVKQGGIRGLGLTMITQRAASLSWEVLSQVEALTVLRMTAPLDIKPVRSWLEINTTPEFAKTAATEIPQLPVGTAFVAFPAAEIAERVQVRARRTYNSGATPKQGEVRAEPTVLAQIDIDKLGKEIAASVKRAQESSPEGLKTRITELEDALARKNDVVEQAVHAGQEKEIAMLRERIWAAMWRRWRRGQRR